MDKTSAPSIEKTEKKAEVAFGSGVKLACKEGEKVNEDQVIGKITQKGEIKEYDLTKILRLGPKKVRKHLLCSLGSKVFEDQLIAEKKSLLRSLVFRSPVNGVIEALTERGILKIRLVGDQIDVISPVKGKVEKISPREAVISFKAAVLKTNEGWGKRKWGILKLVGQHNKKVELSEVDQEAKDKVLVVAREIFEALAHKAEALGAAGIVGGKYNLDENGDLIVLVAGDKEGVIAEKLWQEIDKYQDKKVLIDGEKKELVIPVE